MSDRLPLGLPALDIEPDITPAQEAALLARVQAKWTLLGQHRPHWSMDTNPAFLPDAIDDNRDAFEAAGRKDAEAIRATLARHGFAPTAQARLCDYGCGVGRVTLLLAADFAHVTACDVSTPHMLIARSEAARRGLANITFSLVNAIDFGMVTPFDLWLSQRTLQHTPAPVALRILARAFALLAPGGIALFQIPTYRLGYRFHAAEILAGPAAEEDFEIHPTPQDAIFRLAHAAGLVPLDIREDTTVWPPSLVISNTMVFRKLPSHPA